VVVLDEGVDVIVVEMDDEGELVADIVIVGVELEESGRDDASVVRMMVIGLVLSVAGDESGGKSSRADVVGIKVEEGTTPPGGYGHQ